MRLLRFARNDRGLVSDLERSPTRRGCNPQCKKGYEKLSPIEEEYFVDKEHDRLWERGI